MIRLLLLDAREGRVTVAGAAEHYVFRVHRLKVGDALEVFDGKGLAYPARVVAENALELGPPSQAPRVREVHVLQGMPKADKLELVVQKASELWASSLTGVFCERSVVKSTASDARKTERWQKIADEAARQCGRSDVMKVNAPVKLQAVEGRNLLVLDEEEDSTSLAHAVRALSPDAALSLLIGPEGGFSDAERTFLEAKGAKPVTLGKLILRTETAALAALCVVRHLDGLLG